MGSVTTFPQRTGVYDGTFPRVLVQSAIPFILAGGTAGGSSNQFTMGNNGAISTLPVLPTTYSGGAFIYMPANAIFAGSTAGWYWFVASSTTAGTVYNNTYTSGDPKLAVPATPTPFVSTGPGLVTQTTSQIASLQHIVPGNSMGPNGRVDQLARWNAVGTVGKTVSIGFGGPIGLVGTMSPLSAAMGSSLSGGFPMETVNRNSVANQETFPRSGTGPYGFSGNGAQFATFDTTQHQYAGITLQLGATTEAVILSAYLCEVRYGA